MKNIYPNSMIIKPIINGLPNNLFRMLMRSMLVVVCFGFINNLSASAPIKYVKTVASGSGDGSSWINASGNLQAMIDALYNASGGEVWVAAGTYKPLGYPTGIKAATGDIRDYAFAMQNGVKVYGGFAGTETLISERTGTNKSSLNGNISNTPSTIDDVYHVVISVKDDNTTVLDGFTIDSANADGGTGNIIVEDGGTITDQPKIIKNKGGGLYCYKSNMEVNNCIFKSNNVNSYGAGIYNFKSSPSITSNTFQANNAGQYGAGIYNDEESSPSIINNKFTSNVAINGGGIFNSSLTNPIIKGCIFTGNSASQYGGGIYSALASPQITNCVFTQNSATEGGGGIYNSDNTSLIINCLFNANSSGKGAGVYNIAASTIITNCTFYSNLTLPTGGGGGVFNFGSSTNSKIRNSIFVNNKKNTISTAVGADIDNQSSAKVTVTNTLLQLPNNSSNYPSVASISGFQATGTTGNFYTTNPLFVTPSNPIGPDLIWATADDGLKLQNCSPLINLGNNSHNTELKDITGVEERHHNTDIDFGAYENEFGTMEVAIARNSNGNPYVCVGELTTFTATPTYPGLYPNYEFFLNNVSVKSSSSTTYSLDSLKHDDQIRVKLTSQACTAKSDTIRMVVHAPVLTTVSNSPVCVNDSLGLSTINSASENDISYVWTGPGFTLPNFNQKPFFDSAKVSMSGVYKVLVTDKYSCTTLDSVTVLVNPLPIPVVSNNSPVCVGQVLNLTSSNIEVSLYNFYEWTGPAYTGAPGSDQNPTFNFATELMTGRYKVVITDNNGCQQIDSTDVIVNSLPIPSASDNSPVCAGQVLNLFSEDTRTSPVAPLAFLWKGPAFEPSSIIQNPVLDSATMAMNGIHTVIITDGNGCVDSTTTTVVVNSLPIPKITYNDPVCAERTLNLTSLDERQSQVPAYSYQWRGPLAYGSSDQNPSLTSSTVTMSGTYFLTMTDGNTCVDSTTIDVTVHSLPIPEVSYNDPVCVARTIELFTKDTRDPEGTSLTFDYSWTGPLSYSSNQKEPDITNAQVNMSGTYSVTLTDQYTCSTSATLAVTVHSLPIPEVSYNDPVCVARTIELFTKDTRDPEGTSLTFGYSWTGPLSYTSNLKEPDITNAQVNMTGEYHVTLTDQFTCSTSATLPVIVHSLPIPEVSYNDPVCVARTIELFTKDTRDPEGTSLTFDYSWTGPLSYSSNQKEPDITNAQVNMSGTYSVTLTDQYTCSTSATLAVTVHSLPIPEVSYNDPVCVARTIELFTKDTRDPEGTSLTFDYSWTGPLSYSSNQKEPDITNAQVNMTGNYSVTLTDQFTCSTSATLPVIVHSLPIPEVSYNDPVCVARTIELFTKDTRDPEGTSLTFDYSWTGPLSYSSNLKEPDITNAQINMTGDYHVTLTDQFTCSTSATLPVIVHSLPIPEVSYNDPVCVARTIELFTKDTRDPEGTSLTFGYSWTGPLSYSSNQKEPDITNSQVNMSGTYSVTLTDQFTCSTSATLAVTVHSLPIPEVSYNDPVCVAKTIELFTKDTRDPEGTSLTFGYSWTGPLSYTSNIKEPEITNAQANMSGTYSVTLTDQYTCSTSATLAVTVHSLPTPKAVYNDTVCAGNDLNLLVTDTRGAGDEENPYTYSWTGNAFTALIGDAPGPNGLKNPIFPNAIASMAGKYNVTVGDQYGCSASTSVEVVIHSLPIPNAVYNIEPVCVGKTLNLDVNDVRPSIDQQPPYQYRWSGPAFGSVPVSISPESNLKNPVFDPATKAMGGKYYVTVTDIFKCSASTNLDVLIHTLPVPSTSSNSPVCSAETLNLFANDTRAPQINPYTYSWSGPNDYTSNDQNPVFNSVSVSLTGVYSVTISDNFGCTATANTEVINHHPIATASNDGPYEEGENVNLLATGGTRFDWTGPNGFTSNLVNPKIPNGKTINSGIYSVTVTYQFCTATAITPVNIACSSPALSYYLAYSDMAVPEIITPVSSNMLVQKSTRPMTIVAIPSCSFPTIESIRLHISGVGNNHFYIDNNAPFSLYENAGTLSGDVLVPTVYTFIARAFDQDNAGGNVIIGPDNIQFRIIDGTRTINQPALSNNSVCAGSSITLTSDSTGTYEIGNIYQAYLSDQDGNFNDPVLIGSSSDPKTINCIIPNYIAGGSNYKVMIRSSAPIVSSISVTTIAIAPASLILNSPNNNLVDSNRDQKAIYTIEARNKISGTSTINYKAQYNVTLKPGFEANNGTVFLAEIGNACAEDN